MKSILLAIGGLFIGAFVNMGIIQLGTYLIKAPGAYDLSTEEGLAQAMPLMGFEHFVFPFLAHALGTVVGAYFVTKMKVDKPLLKSMAIGFAFLAGGVMMVLSLPQTPLAFSLVDLLLAYLPMAYLGYRLAHIGTTQLGPVEK
jgi:RsiW-degrading membrane proteinase PrsW (M82 family)